MPNECARERLSCVNNNFSYFEPPFHFQSCCAAKMKFTETLSIIIISIMNCINLKFDKSNDKSNVTTSDTELRVLLVSINAS